MLLTSPVVISALFATGMGILCFFVLPGKQHISLAQVKQTISLRERMRVALLKAGIIDKPPSLFMLGGIGAAVAIGIIAVMLLGPVYYFAVGPVIVPIIFYMYLSGRERSNMDRAYAELVPFLNRISTAVTGGLPMPRAYMMAVQDSVDLQKYLADSAARIAAGADFVPELVKTIPDLPLRQWSNFVRQVELHEEVGGDITRTLNSTISQISKMQQLQAEARADFKMQEKQQRVIMIIVSIGIVSMLFVLPGSDERLSMTIGSPTGIVMLVAGAMVMAGGVFMLRKQLKDIRRAIDG